MHRIIRNAAILLTGILALVACDLDKPQNYTFSYSLYYSVAEEDTQKAVIEYFKEKIDFSQTFQLYGDQHEVTTKANEKFLEDVKVIKNEEVIEMLGKNDLVQMNLNMASSKGSYGAISIVYWYHQPDEDGDGSEDGDSSGDGDGSGNS